MTETQFARLDERMNGFIRRLENVEADANTLGAKLDVVHKNQLQVKWLLYGAVAVLLASEAGGVNALRMVLGI